MSQDWSISEVNAIIADYFQMLALEISGSNYNKAEHNRELQKLLHNRTRPSIEFKHRNISAVLTKLGIPYIKGYKPAWNYQNILEDIVIEFLRGHKHVENTFQLFANTEISTTPISFEGFLEDLPEKQAQTMEPQLTYRNPIKINYLEAEQANRQIGLSGEKIVIDYERWRLINQGKESLAEKIEWVSQTQGDGLGFDILSKNGNGTDRYIEVKSTKLTKEAPIFFTKNEYDFSANNAANYFLYRVFNLKENPRMFIANGGFDDFCTYQPTHFKGNF